MEVIATGALVVALSLGGVLIAIWAAFFLRHWLFGVLRAVRK